MQSLFLTPSQPNITFSPHSGKQVPERRTTGGLGLYAPNATVPFTDEYPLALPMTNE